MVPRGFALEVRACTSSGALLPNGDVFISAWTVGRSWSMDQQTSSVRVDLPGQYFSIDYDVTISASWSVRSGRTSQRGALLPHSAMIVAWNDAVCAAPANTPTSTPTPGPIGCPGSTSWVADNTVPILAPRFNDERLSTDQNNPTLLLPRHTTFEFLLDRVLHRDPNNNDRAEYSTYFVIYYLPGGSTRVAHSAWYVRRYVDNWGTAHWELAWQGWNGSSGLADRPNPERVGNLPPEGLARGSFSPEITFSGNNAGRWQVGLYRVVARGNSDRRTYYPCPVPFREQSFYFRVSRNTPTPTRTPTRTSTLPIGVSSPTPTNTPTSTPTIPPPPTPPRATTDVRLRIHSPYDRAQTIYTTNSGEFTWPLGERLNWTPYVELSLPPDTNPDYSFRARVLGWSFVSSMDQRAEIAPDALGRYGCREREQPPEEELGFHELEDLEGCVYAYKNAPGVADILRQAHAYWSAIVPPDMEQDVYVYQLPRLQPADLTIQVKVLVEVVEDRSGEVAAYSTQVEQSSFTLNFAVPRSAK